ncbi:galactokinase [Laceyella putida]|uniref:Galactokinase n=1 Tax=Laceyella putida TaxID=110101 RepID=A0ABW2RLT1_9BACL
MNVDKLRAKFEACFGHQDGLRIFFAPGRVNLIGEHTDYNGGYVFPAALTFGTWALVSPREDGMYRFRSLNFAVGVDCADGEWKVDPRDDWANYPKGMISTLQEAFPHIPKRLGGADILYYGTIPNGAGLSSSASILLVTALAITKLAGVDVPPVQLALLAQKAENRFIGVQCGIMDQFAIAMGKRNHAVKLKCDTLEYAYFPIDIAGYKLVITHTNKRRGLAESKYNERRRQCEEGLSQIRQRLPRVQTLGDLSYAEWVNVREAVTDEVIRRRVEHVVSENERVVLATQSLEQHDLRTFGELMRKSHESLRDNYEVTGLELDALYEIASHVEGCIGTRMTGAGFGGCNVSLVKGDCVARFKEQVTQYYTGKTGLAPTFYECEIGDGVKEMTEEEVGAWPFW